MSNALTLAELPRWQRPLLAAVWLGIALALLTPLVVTVETAHPFTVGKAVYARTLAALVFVLWVPLALANAAFRPPRSWLFVLLVVGFLIAATSAVLGINVERSLWSDYDRMQGVVNLAHSLVFTVVLVSIVRGGHQWRVLLGMNVAVSVIVAMLAIGRFHGLDMLYLTDIPERSWRVAASLANSSMLGHYAMLNCFVAAGLAGWSFSDRASFGTRTLPVWLFALYAGAAVLNLWALGLSGTLGAYVAFVAALGALALGQALFAHGKVARRVAVGGLGTAGVIGACLCFLFFVDNPLKVRAQDHPVVQRLAFASIGGRTTQTRLAAWRAGIQGIAERPVLGWGPESFIVPYGKYGAGAATSARAHDRAHNEFIEEVTTKGLLGAVAYVAIWVLTFVVVVRYVKGRRDPRAPPEPIRGQALALSVGTALVADVLLKQTLFAHIVGTLQYTLLLGFVIGLEEGMRRETAGPRFPKPVADAAARWLAHAWSRALVILLTLGVASAAIYSSIAAHAGAKALLQFASPRATLADLDNAISAFPPIANYARRLFIDDLANNWRRLRTQQSREAARQLARADIEAAAAEKAEPHNWVMIHSIARLYRAVAATNPEYSDKAAMYMERALELAPYMAVAPPQA